MIWCLQSLHNPPWPHLHLYLYLYSPPPLLHLVGVGGQGPADRPCLCGLVSAASPHPPPSPHFLPVPRCSCRTGSWWCRRSRPSSTLTWPCPYLVSILHRARATDHLRGAAHAEHLPLPRPPWLWMHVTRAFPDTCHSSYHTFHVCVPPAGSPGTSIAFRPKFRCGLCPKGVEKRVLPLF